MKINEAETINDEYIIKNTHNYNGVILRNKGLDEIKNKFELLCKTIKHYSNKGLKSPLLTIIEDKLEYETCICSCNKCNEIYIIRDDETATEFGVGSSCIKKFENTKLNTELYYVKKGRRCLECNSLLIIKKNEFMVVNSKKNDKLCFICKNQRIYLNVPYSRKDEAKKYGALWDMIKKKWFIYRNNKDYEYFMVEFNN